MYSEQDVRTWADLSVDEDDRAVFVDGQSGIAVLVTWDEGQVGRIEGSSPLEDLGEWADIDDDLSHGAIWLDLGEEWQATVDADHGSDGGIDSGWAAYVDVETSPRKPRFYNETYEAISACAPVEDPSDDFDVYHEACWNGILAVARGEI